MSESIRLIATAQLMNKQSATFHLHDGSSVSGKPFTYDVVGAVVDPGGGSHVFLPWTSVQTVTFEA